MKAKVTLIRYYTYVEEGEDVDECIDKAEEELDRDSRYPAPEIGYDDYEVEILEWKWIDEIDD